MIQFLGNIEAKADAKGRVFIPATSGNSCRPLLKKDSYCARTCIRIAWCSTRKVYGLPLKTNFATG